VKWIAALALLLFAAPQPEIRYFHYQRPVTQQAGSAGQACMAIDPGVFAHANAGLADVRLYQGSVETPYDLRRAAAEITASRSISPLNLGRTRGQTSFDAPMPTGRYSDVQLDIQGHDFLAAVTVWGSQEQTSAAGTRIGSFTIFDLTRQKLGRSTVLHLPQFDFRFLHFQIAGPIAPESVTGLTVTQAPAAPPKYLAVAETATGKRKDRNSIFTFTVPAKTPVDRVLFLPGAQPAAFSRDVIVSVLPVARPAAGESAEPPRPVTASGSILRVHTVRDGRRIDEENLAAAAPSVVLDGPAVWTVSVENGDDAPIAFDAVRLQMAERDLCFDANAGSVYTLYYGDSALGAPQYDYARLFGAQPHPAQARLGGEAANSAYQPRPDERPFTEKHPGLLWAALVLVIVLLGAVALRSAKAGQAGST
jgi:hypothetical protein